VRNEYTYDYAAGEQNFAEGFSDGYWGELPWPRGRPEGGYAEGFEVGRRACLRDLREEAEFRGSVRSEIWTLPRFSEIQAMDAGEFHRRQQEISSALKLRALSEDAEKQRALPARYGPGERDAWFAEQDRLREAGDAE